jgi:hypothetical protein
MAQSLQQFRLASLPKSAKLAITFFVALIGIGYLSSVGHMYFTYAMADGKPGMTPADVRLKLAGKRDRTLLETKLVGGSMAQYLQDSAEREKVLAWVHAGAPEKGFHEVQPVLAQRCANCHSSSGPAKFRPLTNYQEVAAVTQADRGETPAGWARVAHIHLQSLSVIYLLLGLVFAFCGLPERIKVWVVPAPFIALIGDFGARAFVPAFPSLVYLVMASGALGGLATAVMVFGAFWELWLSDRSLRLPFNVRPAEPMPQA